MRTFLAQGRTHLALIRTGLAFFSIAIAFFRWFGLSPWSIFDGALAVGSLIMTGVGIIGYKQTTQAVKNLQRPSTAQEETTI